MIWNGKKEQKVCNGGIVFAKEKNLTLITQEEWKKRYLRIRGLGLTIYCSDKYCFFPSLPFLLES